LNNCRIKIQENIPLAPYTTFRLGGPAKFFCEVSNEKELEEAVTFANEKKLAIFWLGGGSNLVVSDDGFNGLVIKIVNGLQFIVKNDNIECWSGENLASIVSCATENSLAGLEWAAGIPGTIGGAVRGNAGAFGGSMAEVVENVRVLDLKDHCYKNFSSKECVFNYRNSIFKENENLVVISIDLRLHNGGNRDELATKVREIIGKRNNRYPKYPSAGSFFQNPVVNDPEIRARFERDIKDKCRDNKVAAGWLVEEAGLRGKKVGHIQVSDSHANFLVNLGGGKASEVVMLASIIKQKIRDEFGVQLSEEVKYVGY